MILKILQLLLKKYLFNNKQNKTHNRITKKQKLNLFCLLFKNDIIFDLSKIEQNLVSNFANFVASLQL